MSKEIVLRFSPEMKRAAMEGRKIATTRSEQKGSPGDTFTLDGVRFRILEVHRIYLADVRNLLYALEGFTSPRDFEDTWRRLHHGHFPASNLYHIHFFARIPEGEEHYGG